MHSNYLLLELHFVSAAFRQANEWQRPTIDCASNKENIMYVVLCELNNNDDIDYMKIF